MLDRLGHLWFQAVMRVLAFQLYIVLLLTEGFCAVCSIFEDPAGMTRAQMITVTLLTSLTLACVVTIKVFFDPEPVPDGTVKAFATLVGAYGLAGLVELVKARRRKKEDGGQ